MIFSDEARAAKDLANLNYYRLAAYWLPFEEDHATHRFRADTTFEKVVALYNMDRALRLLMLDAIERIEIAVRARWSYELAHAAGPHAHLNAGLARDLANYWHDCVALLREVKRSDEVFAKHLQSKYNEPLPPLWAASELMSFGLLSRWYAGLKPLSLRSTISGSFNLDHKVLESWLHHLTIVRNICAHHGRLWNRDFTVTPAAPKTKPSGLRDHWHSDSRRLFNTLLLTQHLVREVAPGSTWLKRLGTALSPLPRGFLTSMGFPETMSVDDLVELGM